MHQSPLDLGLTDGDARPSRVEIGRDSELPQHAGVLWGLGHKDTGREHRCCPRNVASVDRVLWPSFREKEKGGKKGVYEYK